MCFLSGSLVLLQYQVLRRSKSFRTVSCEGASFPPRMAPKGSRLARLAAFEAWAVEHAGVLAERARTRPAASDDPIAQLLNVLRQKSSTEEQQYYHLLNGLQSRRWRAMDAEEREAAQRIWHTVSLRPVLPSNRGTADSAGVPAPVAEGSSASASGGDETAAVSRLLKYGDWRKASSSRLRSALGMFAPDAEAPRSALLQACEKLCDSQRPAELGDPELSGAGPSSGAGLLAIPSEDTRPGDEQLESCKRKSEQDNVPTPAAESSDTRAASSQSERDRLMFPAAESSDARAAPSHSEQDSFTSPVPESSDMRAAPSQSERHSLTSPAAEPPAA